MLAFLRPFESIEAISKARESLKKTTGGFLLSGVSDAEKCHVIYGACHDVKKTLIVTFDEMKAAEICEEYSFFNPETYLYPGKDLLFYQSDIRGNALEKKRLTAIKALLSEPEVTIVTTFDALMNKMAPMELLKGKVIPISTGDAVDMEELSINLVTMGYEKVSQTENPGEFAVRGGIIDIFPLTEDHPFRIELWGDEVDSIRSFDEMTQKSVENLDMAEIFPAAEYVIDEDTWENGLSAMREDAISLAKTYREEMKTEAAYHIETLLREAEDTHDIESHLLYFCRDTVSLLDYFGDDSVVILDEAARIEKNAKAVSFEFRESMKNRLMAGYVLPRSGELLYDPSEIYERIGKKHALLLAALDTGDSIIKPRGRQMIHAVQRTSFNNSFPMLLKELSLYKKRNYSIIIMSQSRTRARRIAEELFNEGQSAFYSEDFDREMVPGEIMVTAGGIKRGFEYPDAHFAVITDSDIFGQARKKKRKKKKYEGEQIAGFHDLSPGDYVVHENHGVGIYRGLEKIEVGHIMKDYIKIEYAKGGNLYIPATQLSVIQKYGNSEGKKLRLSTLGGKEWQNTKTRVREAVGIVAKELVELYALRQNTSGYEYGPDTVWQVEFEETFPYEETESQLMAISDVKSDMMSKKIMDRLICGDVGYGKTEIAIRAAFKAVQEQKQVVVLCPTTILAEQHYNTFVQRMKDFPVNIGLLCRFRTDAEQKQTVKELESGMLDIVIGTHRVLSKDVKYKDLGLLIIDEEQRFGVGHKEKIKQMKKNVDVLSLSATPIPRTLHMSLVGIRDMSLLEEAPEDRMPIQTFVFEYNEEMIREAIVREMARGGQVYYVMNRVRTIADVAARVQELVPDAHVAYAHGKMRENELESIMYDFINHDIDVLVATTIIEIGLDISNVNTIIIHDSDRLGLSQLYQLRGRVGRSNRTAYAFLMYKKDKMLKEVAEKRLSAIREFTDLGSGFKIAMRDLEIRGAGNMLGKEQSGHMEAVGYDLYCKMLNEAVLREKGELRELFFETTVDMNIDAYIPPSYIKDEMQRLDIYKRIAGIGSEEEKEEMLDELIDRFREPPKSVMNLLYISMLRVNAHKAYISEIAEKGDRITFTMIKDARIDPAGIPPLIEKYQPYMTFSASAESPFFTLYFKLNSRLDPKTLPEYIMGFVTELYHTCVENAL